MKVTIGPDLELQDVGDYALVVRIGDKQVGYFYPHTHWLRLQAAVAEALLLVIQVIDRHYGAEAATKAWHHLAWI